MNTEINEHFEQEKKKIRETEERIEATMVNVEGEPLWQIRAISFYPTRFTWIANAQQSEVLHLVTGMESAIASAVKD